MKPGTELTRKFNRKMTPDTDLYPRFAERPLKASLADSPAVLIHGPRQCGKTTLARMVYPSENIKWPGGTDIEWPGATDIEWPIDNYVTFDDDVARESAESDPIGFVNDLPHGVILDEVQRAPSIFTALKMAIDRDRIPGRFLLTGSSHVLLVPQVSDSLAGRMEIIRLHPLAQCELSRRLPTFLDQLFSGEFKAPPLPVSPVRLVDRIVAGGFPAALARSTEGRRRNWYLNYVETQLQRDVRDIARITDHEAMTRLLGVAAAQTARLYNLLDMSSVFSLSRPTLARYVEILERIFLLERIPAWHNKPIEENGKGSEIACLRYGHRMCCDRSEERIASKRPGSVGTVSRIIRVSGVETTVQLVRRATALLPLPGQGHERGRPGHRERIIRRGRCGSKGIQHGTRLGLPRFAQTQGCGR